MAPIIGLLLRHKRPLMVDDWRSNGFVIFLVLLVLARVDFFVVAAVVFGFTGRWSLLQSIL